MHTPEFCNAKLILPRDRAIWHTSGFCQQSPLPGKRRCARHGGRCTGARTPEGMAAVAQRMKAGRLEWIERMRQEGRALPFAGFKAKGSGIPREARENAKAARACQRETYSQAKEQAEAAMSRARTIRAIVPAYVRRDHLKRPGNQALAVQAMLAFEEVKALPVTGPFADRIALAQNRAFNAALPLVGAFVAEAAEAEKRQQREEAARQGERNLQTLIENGERWRGALARAVNLT